MLTSIALVAAAYTLRPLATGSPAAWQFQTTQFTADDILSIKFEVIEPGQTTGPEVTIIKYFQSKNLPDTIILLIGVTTIPDDVHPDSQSRLNVTYSGGTEPYYDWGPKPARGRR